MDYLDVTKVGNIGFSKVPWKKNILFTELYVQPGNTFVWGDDKDKLNSQYFKGGRLVKILWPTILSLICISILLERYDKYMLYLQRYTILTIPCQQWFGRPTNTWNSHGIWVWRAYEVIYYGNVILLSSLRLDKKKNDEMVIYGDWTHSVKWTWNMRQIYVPMAVHNCGSHSYWAIIDWVDNNERAIDAPEVVLHKEQFITMFSVFTKQLKHMEHISKACWYTCSLITIISEPTILYPDIDLDTETHNNVHDGDFTFDLAENMIKVIESQTESLYILSD